MARNDLIRLLDNDIQRAYQLCFALLRDEGLAETITLKTISSFDAQVTEEKKKLRRLLRKLRLSSRSRSYIQPNYLFILQNLLYLKTKKAEEQAEKRQRTPEEAHRDVLLLRYLKYLATVAMDGALEATVAYCRVLHDYGRSVAVSVLDLLAQERTNVNPEGEFSRRKTKYDEYLLSRFHQLSEGPKEPGNVTRFVQAQKTKALTDYVLECLKLLRPWDMSCTIPEGMPAGSIDLLSDDGDDPVRHQAVEEQRINTVMDYECLTRLMRMITNDSPLTHLQIPKFFMPGSGDPAAPSDLKNLPLIPLAKLRLIKNKLADQGARRESIMPRRLEIVVDEETVGEVSLNTARERTRKFSLDNSARLIELYAVGEDETSPPLASKLLRHSLPSTARVTSFSVKWESGQKISLRVSYVPDFGGGLAPAEVTVSYRETNWARALVLFLRSQGSGTAPGSVQPISMLVSFLREFATPVNLALKGAASVFCVLLLWLGAIIFYRPSGPLTVVRTYPASSPISLPSPHPSATAYSAPTPDESPSVEIVQSMPHTGVKPPYSGMGTPRIDGPSEDRTRGVRAGGTGAPPETVPLAKVRTVFIEFQGNEFKNDIADLLKKRLKNLGISTDVDENQADATLFIQTNNTGQFSFVMVSGRKEVWGPATFDVPDKSPAAADKVAASVLSAIEKARENSAQITP